MWTRSDDDVTVGGALVQTYGLLFLQHQQTEECGCCLSSTAILTHVMKVECCIGTAVLPLLGHVYQHHNRDTKAYTAAHMNTQIFQ